MAIQAVRGTRDILPDEVAAWHAIEAAARDLFARYGYREIRTPIFEDDGAVRPRHRGRDRHRREGDVHVRRPGRRLAHPAARGHRRGRARRDRAQPDEQRPRAEGLRDGAHVPPRAAPEGPLPAVPPGGRGGLRLHEPHDRRGDDRAGARLPRRLRRERPRAGPQLGGRPRLPAGLRRAAARRPAGRGAHDVRRLPAAGRHEPAARARLQGARGPGRRSTRCRGSRTTCAAPAPSTSPRCAGSSSFSASRTA